MSFGSRRCLSEAPCAVKPHWALIEVSVSVRQRTEARSTAYLAQDAVKIKVEKGWVTLTGEVEWQYQRQAAAAAIRYLMGVSGVSDHITIKTKVSAPVIKSDIEAALKRRAQQDAHEISVSVHGTDVTLTGKVHSWSERELARNTAWGTPGVRSVVDNTTMSY
jgi:osmotically-inducible protein OsmY